MKVKIGNKIYDSEQQPIMLILSREDKLDIANMAETATKFCSYPGGDDWTVDRIKKWMDMAVNYDTQYYVK